MSVPKLYLKAKVTRKWQQIVAEQDRIFAFSPYITASAMTDALAKLGERCRLYTDMAPENFATQASHLHCIRQLVLKHKVQVLHLPGIHAKLVLVPGRVVTVGSQNFTVGGTRNLEATLVSDDSRVVGQALAEAEGWIKDGNPRPVTEAWLDDLRETVTQLRKDYRRWETAAAETATTFWKRQQGREDDQRERELEAQRLADEELARRQKERDQQAEKERCLKKLRYASEVVTGRMSGRSLKRTRQTSQFTLWSGDPNPYNLRGNPDWYVCFLRDSMRWGWARVCDTCISFVNTTYQPEITLAIGADRYKIRVASHHDQEDPTSNIQLVVTGAGWRVELFGMFCVGGLTIDRTGVNQNPEVANRVTRTINDNSEGVRDEVLRQLTVHRCFRLGDRASTLFGGEGATYHVQLGFLGGNEVLVAGLEEPGWYERVASRQPPVGATN